MPRCTLGVAHGKVIRVLGEQRRIVVSDFGVDDVSARGHTDLALVHEQPKAPTDTAFSKSTSSITMSAEFHLIQIGRAHCDG